jgi:hypothetical protein
MRAPVGLEAPGRKFWREVMEHFVPNPRRENDLGKGLPDYGSACPQRENRGRAG